MDRSLALPAQQSRLVTFVAWAFIIMAGLSVLGSLLQNAMVAVVSSQNSLNLDAAFESGQIPPGFSLLFENIRLLSFLILLASGAVLYASIEFLRRREWARVAMIVILSLNIAWTFTGLALQYVVATPMLNPGEGPFSQPQEEMARLLPIVMLAAGVMATLHVVFCGWLIVRFSSPAVKAEFQRAQ